MNDWKSPLFQHVEWEPDARERRRFAVSMLLGFGVLGLLVALRRQEVGIHSLVLWGIGLALAAAAPVPVLGRLGYLAVWLPATTVGFVISRVLLTVIFVVVITPLGALLRLLGKDLLRLRPGSTWERREGPGDARSYYRPF